MEGEKSYEWPPLESDPQIFNKYFHKIGLSSNVEFDELWTLDYKEVQFFDAPIIGVIANIRRPKGKYFVEENLVDYQNVPFYMKQQGSLDYACGLVAGLHCIGNSKDFFELSSESILGNYFSTCSDKNPEERCKILEANDQFKEAHISSAQEGQSAVPSDKNEVFHHFIAFINFKNSTYELDGTLPGPILIKKDSSHLLDDAIEELKKRLELGIITDDLSVIVVKMN